METITLEDDRVQEIRRKVNSDPKGYIVLTKEELSYLFSKTAFPHEQKKIQIVYGLKTQEELIEETRKLAEKTAWLAYATWVLVAITFLSMIGALLATLFYKTNIQ